MFVSERKSVMKPMSVDSWILILGFNFTIHSLVYHLKDDSALIGQECTICFEDFIEGKEQPSTDALIFAITH
jgi:hypothetical protein